MEWDLLLMGAHGDASWRELILGGATAHILRPARIPLLLAHWVRLALTGLRPRPAGGNLANASRPSDLGPMRRLLFSVAALAMTTAFAQSASADTWGYVLGATHPARQGNFCSDEGSAREIAGIFQRYGARTGFSALSSSRTCSTRVHSVTPEALLEQVRVPLDGGGEYFVNFIQVQAEDGTRPILVTTRQLIQD